MTGPDEPMTRQTRQRVRRGIAALAGAVVTASTVVGCLADPDLARLKSDPLASTGFAGTTEARRWEQRSDPDGGLLVSLPRRR